MTTLPCAVASPQLPCACSLPISVGSSRLSSSIVDLFWGSEDDARISGSRDWDSEDDPIHVRQHRGQGQSVGCT